MENYYENLFFKEETIKEYEKLPNKINALLEEGKKIENNWEESKIIQIISDCINIENSIKDINIINEKIEKCKINNDIKIIFSQDEENINSYIETLKNFGRLSNFDSLIIKNDDDYIKFDKLVLAKERINNAKLIYRTSVDGLNFNSIVNKVNNKSNLLFLYHTENNRIFGAVIRCKLENINLNGSRKYYKDEKVFSFSLNNNKIYKILAPGNAIAIDSDYYILIGNNNQGNGFYIQNNLVYDSALINGTKIYDFSYNSELTGGYMKLKELEIFQI